VVAASSLEPRGAVFCRVSAVVEPLPEFPGLGVAAGQLRMLAAAAGMLALPVSRWQALWVPVKVALLEWRWSA